MSDKLKFLAKQVRKWLWIRPLVACILSIVTMLIAKAADHLGLEEHLPHISIDSIETLLSIMGSSMLVIATFAVGSMIGAFASAGRSATPRAFPLIIEDDLSQNALSVFVGSFIFSIMALTTIKNDVFQGAGLTVLFAQAVIVLGAVIIMFVLWVDRISRLGRMVSSIEKVEKAAAAAMRRRKTAPALCGVPARRQLPQGQAVYSATVGYLEHIDLTALQACAEKAQGWVAVAALPGTFVAPGHALAYVGHDAGEKTEIDCEQVASAFVVGRSRHFDEDPRFGLVVLSEIADKALSPGVNDPGTAISIIGSLIRLFVLWADPVKGTPEPEYDRVEAPLLSVRDMFDDAFTAIARDGAGTFEVMLRLQKGLEVLSTVGDPAMRDAALAHSRLALVRAEKELGLPEHVARVREAAAFSQTNQHIAESHAAQQDAGADAAEPRC